MASDELKAAAAALGRAGGLKKSERKAAACRANGKLARRKRPAPVKAQPTPVESTTFSEATS